jgi:hypothetical protein
MKKLKIFIFKEISTTKNEMQTTASDGEFSTTASGGEFSTTASGGEFSTTASGGEFSTTRSNIQTTEPIQVNQTNNQYTTLAVTTRKPGTVLKNI